MSAERVHHPIFARFYEQLSDSNQVAGFTVERCRRFAFRPSPIEFAVAPRILGLARRP